MKLKSESARKRVLKIKSIEKTSIDFKVEPNRIRKKFAEYFGVSEIPGKALEKPLNNCHNYHQVPYTFPKKRNHANVKSVEKPNAKGLKQCKLEGSCSQNPMDVIILDDSDDEGKSDNCESKEIRTVNDVPKVNNLQTNFKIEPLFDTESEMNCESNAMQTVDANIPNVNNLLENDEIESLFNMLCQPNCESSELRTDDGVNDSPNVNVQENFKGQSLFDVDPESCLQRFLEDTEPLNLDNDFDYGSISF